MPALLWLWLSRPRRADNLGSPVQREYFIERRVCVVDSFDHQLKCVYAAPQEEHDRLRLLVGPELCSGAGAVEPVGVGRMKRNETDRP